MKMIRAILSQYETQFKNPLSDKVIQTFNSNEKKAVSIITANSNLSDNALSRKVAKILYGVTPSHSTYKKFKETFKSKIKKIIDLCESKISDIGNIYIELEQDRARIDILVRRQMRVLAFHESKLLLKRCIHYHNFEAGRAVCVRILGHLNMHGSQKEYLRYKKKFEWIDNICRFEVEFDETFSKLTQIYYKGSDRKLPIKMAKKYSDYLDSIIKKVSFNSFHFKYKYYSLRLMTCKDDQYIYWCEQALNYLDSLPFSHPSNVSIFKNHILKYRLKEGDIAKCKLVLLSLINDEKKYTLSWYDYNFTLIKCFLHLGQYKDAFRAYEKIINGYNFKILPSQAKSEWLLLGMYVYIVSGNLDKINLHRIKYNVDYKNDSRYIIAEIIYNVYKTNCNEKLLKSLKRISKPNSRERMIYNYFNSGQKIRSNQTDFTNEYISYNRLIQLDNVYSVV